MQALRWPGTVRAGEVGPDVCTMVMKATVLRPLQGLVEAATVLKKARGMQGDSEGPGERHCVVTSLRREGKHDEHAVDEEVAFE